MTSTNALRLEYRDDHVAVLTFDQPGSRANTLGQAALAEFEVLLAQLKERTDLHGLVLQSGKPGMFIAGADIKELGSARMDQPQLVRALMERGLNIVAGFEALPFPTVAAIDGACVGGGCEFALGFDARLAGTHPKFEIGLPEVKLGIIPGWGGTQRLPRLIGPSLAAEMICSGETAKAARAFEIGIVFDVVPSERLLDEAVRLVKDLYRTGKWKEDRKRRSQPIGLTEDQALYTFAVAKGMILEKTKGQMPAPLAALDAIEKGCNRPLTEALPCETEAMIPLVGSTISRNLIALFFNQQRMQKDTGVADANVQPATVKRVGVLGAGIMGAGIASVHARKGIPVILLDSNPQALEKGIGNIATGFKALLDKGRMKPEEMVAALARVGNTTQLATFADCDVVVEAVVENEEVKTNLYKQLEPLLRPDAILASNTSTISITRMAKSLQRPERFAGMHFFNPVERMPLVEVIRGEKTDDRTTATLVSLARQIGKSPIVVKDGPGFLVNRILFPYMDEALQLLLEGAEPRAIDQAAVAFGMPMGPITLYDVVGLDTALYAGRVMQAAFPERSRPSPLLVDLVAAGRLGQKSGAGFYRYPKGPKGEDDPKFVEFLTKHRRETRKIPTEEITERLFLPMLTEATHVLAEGLVRNPADIDMGLILGIGFPPYRGGILRWADSLGAKYVLSLLEKYRDKGACFVPSAQFVQWAASGEKLFPM